MLGLFRTDGNKGKVSRSNVDLSAQMSARVASTRKATAKSRPAKAKKSPPTQSPVALIACLAAFAGGGILLTVLTYSQLKSNAAPLTQSDLIVYTDQTARPTEIDIPSIHGSWSPNGYGELKSPQAVVVEPTEGAVERSPLAADLDFPKPVPEIAAQSSPDAETAEPAFDASTEADGDESDQISDEPTSNDSDSPGVKTSSGKETPTLASLVTLAASLIKQSKGKEAVQTLRKASNLYPKDAHADFYLGLVHSGIGINEWRTAEQHYQRVLDRSPGHPATLNNLALVEIKGRNFRPARNYLALAAKQNPRPPAFNQNLGRLISQAKLLEVKAAELKQFNGLNTEADLFDPQIGWVYMPFDDTETSKTEYQAFCREGNLEDCSCNICSGRASLPCSNCNKNGTVLVAGSYAQTVVTQFGSINTATPTTTEFKCDVCLGKGRIDCPNCKDGRDPSLRRPR